VDRGTLSTERDLSPECHKVLAFGKMDAQIIDNRRGPSQPSINLADEYMYMINVDKLIKLQASSLRLLVHVVESVMLTCLGKAACAVQGSKKNAVVAKLMQ